MAKTAGIIAELNPYHNGHEALIREARRLGADRIVVLMSGDYVQRGTPAIVDRWTRAEMVLGKSPGESGMRNTGVNENKPGPDAYGSGGADLVLSFPTRFATAGAEEFAAAGVEILDGIGCIDTIVFGSESADRERIRECAEILAEEPEWYRTALKKGLCAGTSFARAREAALPDFADLLRSPNDILAVEYVKAMIRIGSTMNFECVKRVGAGHRGSESRASEFTEKAHSSLKSVASEYAEETHHGSGCGSSGTIRSASDIRAMIEDPENRLEYTLRFIPPDAGTILKLEVETNGVMTEDVLSDILLSKLWQAGSIDGEDLSMYKDVTPDLARTITREREHFQSFSSFSQRITSKTLTRSHANRALLHIALGIRKDDMLDHVRCAQVIGFNEKGREIISAVSGISEGTGAAADGGATDAGSFSAGNDRAKTLTELVINPARDIPGLSESAQSLMGEDFRVSNLYLHLRAVHNDGGFVQEIRHPLLRK